MTPVQSRPRVCPPLGTQSGDGSGDIPPEGRRGLRRGTQRFQLRPCPWAVGRALGVDGLS